jgi:hypothetical protein
MTTNDLKTRVVNKAIDDKVTKLDKETAPIVAYSDGHKDLARRIVDCMRKSIIAYYHRYPDRALDERGRDNEEWNIWRVKEILMLLDDYDICIKVK